MAAALHNLSQDERKIVNYRHDELTAQIALDSSLEIALQKMYDEPKFYETAYAEAPKKGLAVYAPVLYEINLPEKSLSSLVRFRFINHAENLFCLEATTAYKTSEKKNFLYVKRRATQYVIVCRTDSQR